jgi:hypothetical protein
MNEIVKCDSCGVDTQRLGERRREYARDVLDLTNRNLPDEFRRVLGIDEDGETCELCGDSEEVEGGLCAACFAAAPVGVWFGSWGVS